jgi:hypothetical protein
MPDPFVYYKRNGRENGLIFTSTFQMAALEQSSNATTESLAKLIAEQKEKQRLERDLAIASFSTALTGSHRGWSRSPQPNNLQGLMWSPVCSVLPWIHRKGGRGLCFDLNPSRASVLPDVARCTGLESYTLG